MKITSVLGPTLLGFAVSVFVSVSAFAQDKPEVKPVAKPEAQLTDAEKERFFRAAQQTQDQSEGALATIAGLNAPNPPFPALVAETSKFFAAPAVTSARLNFSTPLLTTETETWSGTLAAAHIDIADKPVLSSGDGVPESLDRVELALQYEKKLPGYRRWSVKGSVGSSGDELFKTGKDSLLSLNLSYGYPSRSGGFWNYFLFLSNNSPFGSFVPIPGVLYVVRTPTFTGLFGIPVISLQWSVTPRSTLSFSQTGLAMTAEATYGNKTNAEGFVAFNWANQSFILNKRVSSDDRFTLEDKKFSAGVRVFALSRMILEAQAGYAFDRLIYSGQGMRNFRRGRFDADSGTFALLSLKSRI